MPLFARNFSELVTDSLEDLGRDTNITRLSSGAKARSILESVNKRLEESYQIFDLNLARAFVSGASGQFLELIGELLGVTRDTDHAATATEKSKIVKVSVLNGGTFGSINNGADIFMREGVTISTEPGGGGISYRLSNHKVLLASETQDFIEVEALSPGESANIGASVLRFHSFADYQDVNNDTLVVTNLHPISNGRNFESDPNYRFRIVNRALEAEAGNETAIRLAALSTPGVADVFLVKHYRGIGTYGAIIQSTAPTVSETLISLVQGSLRDATSFGDIAFVRKPKETGFTMRLTVHYSQRLSDEELGDIEENLIDTVISYVNNLDIGEALEVNLMVADLFDVDPNIANFGQPGKSVDESYIYIESKLEDNRVKSKLLGDYSPAEDERVIIEPSVQNPIVIIREFTRR